MATYNSGRTKRVTQKYIDFSGGFQGFLSPLLLKSNESPFCYNVDISRVGKLRKDNGYAELGNATGTGYNRGIFAWNRVNDTNELYQVYGQNLYKWNGSAFGLVGSGFGTGSDHVEFATTFINTGTGVGTAAGTYAERMYISQGLTGEVKYTQGTSISTLAGYYAKHIESYKGRIYLGNVKTSLGTQNSRLIFSNVADDEFPESNIIDDLGEGITALKEFSGTLFVFGQNKVSAWDGYSLTSLNTDGGVINNEVVQKTESRLFWYNRGGVYMYGGGSGAVNIGRPVVDWLDAVVDSSKVTAGIDSYGRYCLYIGSVNYDSSTYNDTVLRYDTLVNAWDVKTNRPFNYWTRNQSGGAYEVYATNPTSQKVWQVDYGYSLNGSAQSSVYQTPMLYGSQSDVDNIKTAYEAQIVYKPMGIQEYITAQYRLDGEGAWNQIGGTNNNINLNGSGSIDVARLILPPKAQGKFVEFKLSHASTGHGFEIYGINLVYDAVKRNG